MAGGSVEEHDYEEDLFTADQVQQLIDEAVQDRMVFATLGAETRGYAPPPWPHYQQPFHQHQRCYQQPPQAFHLAASSQAPQYPVRTAFPCRNFARTGNCQYGGSCKFAHVAEGVRNEAAGGSMATSSATSTPVRMNPFAAKPN